MRAPPPVPNYEFSRCLGRGGMGEVWLAKRPNLAGVAKPVAIKFVPLDSHASDSERGFLDEVRISTLLSHSNLVQVFDVGTTEAHGYIVMEAVDGIDLSHLVRTLAHRGEGLSPRAAAYVVAQLLRALNYAHTLSRKGESLQIVHRDISPHNILISVSGEVKLLDFGIARSRFDATAGRAIKGKLRYMAPEQFAGQAIDARADLYAVGVVLHELLSRLPFRNGESAAKLYAEITTGAIPQLAVAPPATLEALRVQLLQKSPSLRPESAADALRLLESWPGYGDASTELSELCGRITGVAGPRAELGIAAAHQQPSLHTTGSSTWAASATLPTRTAASTLADHARDVGSNNGSKAPREN